MEIVFTLFHPVYGQFTDCLRLPDDHGLDEAQIENLKQQRFDNWVSHILNLSSTDEGAALDQG